MEVDPAGPGWPVQEAQRGPRQGAPQQHPGIPQQHSQQPQVKHNNNLNNTVVYHCNSLNNNQAYHSNSLNNNHNNNLNNAKVYHNDNQFCHNNNLQVTTPTTLKLTSKFQQHQDMQQIITIQITSTNTTPTRNNNRT